MAKSLRETRELSDVNKGEEIGKYTMSVAVMLTNVEAYRIRRFEKAGLLRPHRSRAGQRRYSDTEIGLIKGIAKLEEEGINLQGVKAIMAMRKGERK
ncbi:MAG: MerR family transcriptional regulator [Chloroflexi bacterium]|nr:MerR family transcriptional regulator [Chloroflexota bacterium]